MEVRTCIILRCMYNKRLLLDTGYEYSAAGMQQLEHRAGGVFTEAGNHMTISQGRGCETGIDHDHTYRAARFRDGGFRLQLLVQQLRIYLRHDLNSYLRTAFFVNATNEAAAVVGAQVCLSVCKCCAGWALLCSPK